MKKYDLPLGLGLALVQNEPAMRIFEAMSESEREELIERTHDVRSRQEMQQLVMSLVSKH